MPTAQQRAAYRARGRCPHCGGPCDADRAACARCLALSRATNRQRYRRLRQAGRCVQCAGSVRGQAARCPACRTYQRAAQQAWARRTREDEWWSCEGTALWREEEDACH